MKSTRLLFLTFVSLTLVSTLTTSVQAQDQGDTGADTGTTTTQNQGTTDASSVGLSDDRFSIDRGDTIGGGSDAAGFGVAAESGGARGGTTFGGGGFGGLGGLGGLNNLFGGGFGAGGQGSSQPIIRTRIRSAIQAPPVPPAQVQAGARRTLSQLPSQRQFGRVNVQMQGRTAVLSGAVGNDRDRRMAQLLMRLEPGVNNVQNQIRVQP